MAEDYTELMAVAREAVDHSYAPYSKYAVGAALATADGSVFTGCNVENANYSNSIHAEELALSKAVEADFRSFDTLCVCSNQHDGITPCGMCRQSLAEFCSADFTIVCEQDDDLTTYRLEELLPNTITADHLL